MSVAYAQEKPLSVAERILARKQQTLSESHQRSIQKRETLAERSPAREMREYRDKNGVPLLTNRVEKYQNRREFEEVRLEKIEVLPEYRNMSKAPETYTTTAFSDIVRKYAQHYNLNENLVFAVIKAESNGNARAVSPAGACGLMQLMPGTASEMGVTDIFDPAQNIAGGTQYLSKMMGLFNNDVKLALAGYNAGPEAVRKHNGVPPYNETRNYIRNVVAYWKRFEGGNTPEMGELLARARNTETGGPAAAPVFDSKQIIVHFHSGLKQPADKVEDKEPYYYIHFGQRTYPVRKELVEKIVEPA
ncbi:MAG: lytic transglycosylase domain-containing protein [Candidatus Hydrogenedentes bacterium]|nr:lytic transglycosylase domain-containing protein [Candidatus Hydrogenedentota bacterium]